MAAAIGSLRQHFLWAALFSALLNLLFLAPTLYMLQIYDRVVPTRGDTTLLFLTVVLLVSLAVLSLLDLVRSRLLVRASARLDRSLSGIVADAVVAESGNANPAARQAMREFDQLRQTLSGSALLALLDAPWVPIYLLVCLLLHPWIGLLALVAVLLVLGVAWANERATRMPLQSASEAASRSYVSQEEAIAGAEVIRALGMRGAMVDRHLDERAAMMRLQAQASFAAGGLSALSRFLRTALQSLALGLGALLAIHDQVTAGAIFAASFLIGRALAPIDQLVANWRNIVQARSALDTLRELLSNDDRAVATQLPPPAGKLDVERLVVLNGGGDEAILAEPSFSIAPGEVVALVGPSGAGKSTLARVISGAITPDRGCVRIDGAARSDWDPERLARHIGYLPQDPTLFAGTVKENIARFQSGGPAPEMIDAAVVDAAKICGAHDMILRLPGGYDHALAWGGRGLSAGQAQRIALARALFGNPALLVLDEPNAHLDVEGETALIHALQHAKDRGAAILVIAHRMGVLSVTNRILVLKNGRIEADGPRDEIIERVTGERPRSLSPAAAEAS